MFAYQVAVAQRRHRSVLPEDEKKACRRRLRQHRGEDAKCDLGLMTEQTVKADPAYAWVASLRILPSYPLTASP
jgi:hypothetical protein